MPGEGVAAVSEYRGRAWREGEWWVVDVNDVGATQARTLDKVDHMARSLVADLTDVTYESVAVTITIDLPPAIAGQVEQLRQATAQAAELARDAAELQADVVRSLADNEGLTGREIAAILKVTPGRVSQIAKKAASPPQPRRRNTPRATKSA
jgi:predicted transcriptional regulator